jgi:hypothetical protein
MMGCSDDRSNGGRLAGMRGFYAGLIPAKVTLAASKPGRESSTGAGTPHHPSKALWVSACAGTTPGTDLWTALGGPALR